MRSALEQPRGYFNLMANAPSPTARRPAAAATVTPDDPRWVAVVQRDTRADGVFVYAVKTTGIYCRPACSSRKPRLDNVELFPGAKDAERAGYRACKRCHPRHATVDDPDVNVVVELCRVLAQSEQVPKLDELAKRAGWSVSHTQRTFRRVTGVTPTRFAAGIRSDRVRAALSSGATVTGAILAAGYGSSSRFYEKSTQLLGMTPTQYRARGDGVTIRYATARCSLGHVLGATTDRGVCAILLGDDPGQLRADLERRFPKARLDATPARLRATLRSIVELVERPGSAPKLPLDLHGTAFQLRVWDSLRAVPAGSTTTYRRIAESIDAPSATRAVAGACSANPVAVAVPCHRVLRSDGGLSGYRWGVGRKRALLQRESE